MSTISVIIPAYNRQEVIRSTLNSLLDQTYPAKEIIVVDDGSKDDTAEVARSFGSLVTVVRQENAGPAAARNTGFRASTGEFIHYFDSDDIASSTKHEVQLGALQMSNADIAYSPWIKGIISDGIFTSGGIELQARGIPKHEELLRALLTHWSIVPQACLFRRSIIDRVNGFPEDLFCGEDQMMFLRCLIAGAKVVHTPDAHLLYRTNNAGKITDPTKGKALQVTEWARFLAMARSDCLAHGIDPSIWMGYRRRVWESLDDLKRYEVENADLIKQLNEALSIAHFTFLYGLVRAFDRKIRGIKSRLFGFREHPYFYAKRIPREARLL
ncbi:MAG: glycosyltransferase family A protein [Cyanobacteria bacterium P01_H01_bin.15]